MARGNFLPKGGEEPSCWAASQGPPCAGRAGGTPSCVERRTQVSANSCARGTTRTTAPVPLSWACLLTLPVREKGTIPRHLAPCTDDSLVCSEATVRRDHAGRKVLFSAEARNDPQVVPLPGCGGQSFPQMSSLFLLTPHEGGKGAFKEEKQKQQGGIF